MHHFLDSITMQRLWWKVGSADIFIEGDCSMTFWFKFHFIPSKHSKENDFQRFPIIQPIRRYGSHLEWKAMSPDTILKEDHPRSIISKFVPIKHSDSWEDQNVKGQRTTNTTWWEKLNGVFGSGELKYNETMHS
jgi:hypothetical protein